ncbi:MAG: PAS domain-containing protein [Deltaproteobacteria bacterium]|jgi:two-component system nitrogen regulation sensor histidine kinase NtrY|nr:MAG: PAS domain-containing protein [Deltaproteobacteria bacterium]
MLNRDSPKINIQELKRRKRERYIILFTTILVIFLTFLGIYSSKTGNQLPIANNILVFGLININVILLLLIAFLVVRNIVKLVFERKKNILGSKLRTKFVVAFVSLSIVPTVLLFFVAAGFITNSIENWFNIQVENSLKESLTVAQAYYQNSGNNAVYYAKHISQGITENRLLDQGKQGSLKGFVKSKLDQYNLGAIEVFSPRKEGLAKAVNNEIPIEKFPTEDSKLVQEGLKGESSITKIQSAGKGELIRGVVPIYPAGKGEKPVGVVIVNYFVPLSLVAKMAEISSTFAEYKQLKMLKNPIKTSYFITLSIVTLLIIFSATWFGFYLAKEITVPVQKLANGIHEVANGNLDLHIEAGTDDEIGSLMNSFNKMTFDLKASKSMLEEANIGLKNTNIELDQRRRYMEILLKNVGAGVISIDKEGRVSTINKSAEKIFGITAEQAINKSYNEVFASEYLNGVKKLLEEVTCSTGGTIKRQIRLSLPDETLTLLINVAVLRDEDRNYMGLVVVFDDLTQLQKAQRAEAWREVARRIAHEIKNPLTPIKLSAQRLRKRYLNKFSDNGKVFDECTKTIIDQVEDLKGLVNEFSNFARMPATNLYPNDINKIIKDALVLYQEGHSNIKFEFKEGKNVPIFDIDREQIRRVIINLLDNAVDSIEKKGTVLIETFYDDALQVARVEIADTGCGIPQKERSRLFEPYFSTKRSGTGLGLSIVNTIVSDHNGYIRVKENYPKGSRFIIELPVRV